MLIAFKIIIIKYNELNFIKFYKTKRKKYPNLIKVQIIYFLIKNLFPEVIISLNLLNDICLAIRLININETFSQNETLDLSELWIWNSIYF